jgi:hypothetical protein
VNPSGENGKQGVRPQSIAELREQLRSLGYLTHRLERWFALDPWSSRTFWQELLAVAAKSGVLIAPFVAAPMIAAMAIRNAPMGFAPAVVMGASWLFIALLAIMGLVVASALVMKIRPMAVIERPGLLTVTSLSLSALLAAWVAFWWSGFESRASNLETVLVAALVLALVAAGATVFAAALLSFSIHETHQIPAIARRSRSRAILLAGAAILAGLLALPALTAKPAQPLPPESVLVTPTDARVALIAVDGLTLQLFRAHEGLRGFFSEVRPLRFSPAASAPELWASLGTGTRRELHAVRSIEGLRVGGQILQEVSRHEPLRALPTVARTEPLPSNVRMRHYAWELLAERGVPVVATNWWLTPSLDAGALRAEGQEEIFAAARAPEPGERALEVDRTATAALLQSIEARRPGFATVYLPAVDIAMNRLQLPAGSRPALVVEAIGSIAALATDLRGHGFEILLIGSSGAGAEGEGVLASTIALNEGDASADDVAPTILALFGFPASEEMPGSSLLPDREQARIGSFGARGGERARRETFDREYHEALRSLGYVQ